MRIFLVLALACSSVLVVPGREANAGVVIHDRASPFRTEAVTLTQTYRSADGSVVPAGTYTFELSLKSATTKQGVVIHDLVARLLKREGETFVRKGEVAARLEVDDVLVKQRGVGFGQLGFKDGHKITRTDKASGIDAKLEGAPGVAIRFSIARAAQ